MSKKSNTYIVGAVLFVCVLLIVTALSTAMYNNIRMYEQKQAQPKVLRFKDKAEVVSEVCLSGKHIVVFSVLKKYDSDLMIHIDQAGYKETYSVVVGTCDE